MSTDWLKNTKEIETLPNGLVVPKDHEKVVEIYYNSGFRPITISHGYRGEKVPERKIRLTHITVFISKEPNEQWNGLVKVSYEGADTKPLTEQHEDISDAALFREVERITGFKIASDDGQGWADFEVSLDFSAYPTDNQVKAAMSRHAHEIRYRSLIGYQEYTPIRLTDKQKQRMNKPWYKFWK